MGENLNLMQALYVTISSMAMVFLILLVISGILSLFKYIFKNENNIKKPNANNTCRDFVNNNSVEDNFEIDEEEKIVVVLSSDKMGEGDDELGKVLIKGFIYAITQLDKLPKSVLLYNGGVKLSTEGSDSIEDLKELEEKGVEILSCGTCLNFYNLQDKLKVGKVTNMYSIVEEMSGATNIIRP